MNRKDLFDFMIRRVKQTSEVHGDRLPQAFGRWFATMYFQNVTNILIPDGAGDGKVDLCVTSSVGDKLRYYVLNTKFTAEYDKSSPVAFYDEITRFWQAFQNTNSRAEYLKVVREGLRDYYKGLFKKYDEGKAELCFVTNHKVNAKQFASVQKYGVKIFHLDDVLQYVAEHIEGAMPETEPIVLSDISTLLTPSTLETEVPTSIVFARLVDFIKYMEDDRLDLLFARNVRLWLGNTESNREILNTFETAPKEFAFSNNGITILCKEYVHHPGKKELIIANPRVVNGSQTLHSVRQASRPSKLARVMVRIIAVPQSNGSELARDIERRKDIVHKISIRSNMQNPIKRWNLVSNDDFQNELARYFWTRQLYYERRQHEWKHRSVELKSVGIKKGPEIRRMTQLLAAYYYKNEKLGPANAKGKLNELFEEQPYLTINQSEPDLAYQIYLLEHLLRSSVNEWSTKSQTIKNNARHIDLCLFSLLCRCFNESGVKWGTEAGELYIKNIDEKVFRLTVKRLIDHILAHFKLNAKKLMDSEERELTFANYVKSKALMGELISMKLPV